MDERPEVVFVCDEDREVDGILVRVLSWILFVVLVMILFPFGGSHGRR